MINGFNKIAPYYDGLANLIFKKSIRNSQVHFLNEIKNSARILMLGGGTGWLLPELLKVNPAVTIYYIEASSKMVELAQAAVPENKQVKFIHGTERNIPESEKFDAVITNFYLDMFKQASLKYNVIKVKQVLLPNAKWIVTDFTKGINGWQQTLLNIMYLFFRMVAKIEARHMPDWQLEIRNVGFEEVKSHKFHDGFINSVVYTLP